MEFLEIDFFYAGGIYTATVVTDGVTVLYGEVVDEVGVVEPDDALLQVIHVAAMQAWQATFYLSGEVH